MLDRFLQSRESPEPERAAPTEADSAVAVQVAVSRAAELARDGRYEEAERVLLGLCPSPDRSAPVLDMLARIRAQQGRLAEAAVFWTRASQLDPTCDAYRQGLQQIARSQHQIFFVPPLLSWVIGLLVLLILALTVLTVVGEAWAARAGASADADRVTGELSKLSARIEELERRQRELAGAGPGRPPDLKLAVAGASAAAEGDSIAVTFDEGLFEPGSSLLTPDAQVRLTRLARALGPHADSIALGVVGHSSRESSQDTLDHASLSLHRAAAVLAHLRRIVPLPADRCWIRGLGGQSTPFPNDAAGRRRNQTAVILISAARK